MMLYATSLILAFMFGLFGGALLSASAQSDRIRG